MTHTRFRDFTTSELFEMREEAFLKRQRENRPCLWCDKIVPMWADQHFCRPACRTAYSHAAAQKHYEILCREKSQ